jgi:hypothetical protein
VSLVRKRAIGDVMMSMGTVAVLLAILTAYDDRMREQVMVRLHGDPSAQMASAGASIRALSAVVFSAARDQSIEHAPLVIFVLLATVLLLFMLRT